MSAPDVIRDLVERYERNKDAYKASSYNEAQLRIEFLDPMFEALGWDMANRRGYAERYKEVVHEARVLVAGKSKAPDYAFRIGGVRKFFLEAKKPAVHVGSDQAAALQLRRYAWSAKLPLSILTNFEETSIYDTRIRPKSSDHALIGRLKHIRLADLLARWDELADLFSQTAILSGTFDKFVLEAENRRDRIDVDDAFLVEIERWRAGLADHLALKNTELSVFELQAAVQLVIDRVIFLRIAEDRGIEPYAQLQKTVAKSNAYARLVELFKASDRRYNSGLFHLVSANRGDAPDIITPKLTISDLVIRDIVSNLYYPQSPYAFSAMSADLLGQIYERFLGKVIRIENKHAIIEEKPEVKKAGGVYYTPTYIVSYIVQSTIGQRLAAIQAQALPEPGTLRIVDPACGSGSFLIEAYQHLLDWYLEQYVANSDPNSKGRSPKIIQVTSAGWTLSLAERRRILVEHIYGVDIDAQAVEVAKLSLLLKLLDGLDPAHLGSETTERLLPDLDGNIKCGNSLVDQRYFVKFPKEFSDDGIYRRVNPFNWTDEFPAVFADGGFDVVIGNPPYFSIDNTWGAGDHRISILKELFPNIHTDKTDIYYYFIALAMAISKGTVGFIVSRAFLEAAKASKLRAEMAEAAALTAVVDFGNFRVFPKLGIATAIVLMDKSTAGSEVSVTKVDRDIEPHNRTAEFIETDVGLTRFSVTRKQLAASAWNLSPPMLSRTYVKIDRAGAPLGEILELGQGMQTGANKVFGGLSSDDIRRMKVPPELVRRRITNTDISSFAVRERDDYVLYLEGVARFGKLPLGLRRYLESHREELEGRAAYVRGNCEWWKFTWPLNKDKYEKPRILVPYLSHENRFFLDAGFRYISLTDTTVLFDAGQKESIKYICALLNSSLLDYRFKGIGKLKSAGIYEYFDNSLSKLPIRRIDFSNKADVKKHDEIVSLHDEIARVSKLAAGAPQARQQSMLLQTLNAKVFELYGIAASDLGA